MSSADGHHLDYEVAIVGAGPAGLSTALHLALSDPRLARSCVILEARRHPREKPCAGGITRGALERLRALGVDPGDIPLQPVTEVRARFVDRETPVLGRPACFHVTRRGALDAALAALVPAHGPELVQDTRVRGVEVTPDRVTLTTDRGVLSCRAIVGADGGSSAVRRSMWPRDDGDRVVGLQRIVPRTSCAPTEAVFDFTPISDGLAGYLWDFPAPGAGRSVGVFIHGGSREAAEYLRRNVARLGVSDGSSEPLQGAKVRAFHPRAVMARSRVLLVGDAIGIDPLVGEGIGTALGFGEVAARALVHGLETGDLSFSGYRRAVLAHRVGRSLRGRRLGHRVVTMPGSRLYVGPLWPLIVGIGSSQALGPA